MSMSSAIYMIQVHYPLPLALQTRSTIPTRAIHGGLDDLQSTLERQRKECEKEAEKQSKFCQEKEQQVCLCVYKKF